MARRAYALVRDRDRLPGVRRRQPLLRGDRRVHPASRSEARPTDHPVGRDRRPPATTSSAAGSAGPWSTRRSTRCHRPGPCRSTSGATRRAAARWSTSRAGADPARVPRPGGAAEGHGRAGARPDLAVPDARHDLRGAASSTTPRGAGSCSGPSTAGWRRTGASTSTDRIFAAPYISLADLDFAVSELEWALDQGARTIVHAAGRPDHRLRAAATGRTRCSTRSGPGSTRPASPSWSTPPTRATPPTATPRTGSPPRFDTGPEADHRLLSIERAIYDFLASLLFDKLFDRFPNIRMASVENGSEFLPDSVQEAALDPPQDAGVLHRGPGRDVPPPRVGQPVLGGRRQRDGRADGRRPGGLRLRLATHRRHARARSTTPSSSRPRRRRPGGGSCWTTPWSSTSTAPADCRPERSGGGQPG